jgi:hypothetical protein
MLWLSLLVLMLLVAAAPMLPLLIEARQSAAPGSEGADPRADHV